MATETYLLIAAPRHPDNRPVDPAQFRYIPMACEPNTLEKTVQYAARKSPDMQTVGVLSKGMVLGMLATIEEFENSRI